MDAEVTTQEMRDLERAAMARGAVTGRALMERAGAGTVAAILSHWPELAQGPRRATVLCGPGNNGGDGFVVARLLQARGWALSVHLLGQAARMPPDARANYEDWRRLGPVAPLPGPELLNHPPDLVVDALFGIGLSRPIRGLGALFAALNRETARARQDGGPGARLTAVDIPSGIHGDSGAVLAQEGQAPEEAALRCQLTVTFHRPKPGHRLAAGPAHCGKLIVKDIGL